MKYRDLAIGSVNNRLQAPEKDIHFDLGLVSAIGSLGIWERLAGSKEMWRTHRKGVRMLSERLAKHSQERMLLQIINESEASDSFVWIDNHSEGFTKMRKNVPLDGLLLSAICKCPLNEARELDENQHRVLQEQTQAILAYSSGKALCGRVAGAPNDRRSLEMHVFLQGAGISMISFVNNVNNVNKTSVHNVIEQIDFFELSGEAVELVRSVYLVPSYNELLHWALFTIIALNGYTSMDGIKILTLVAQRCFITNWEQMEILLWTFIYVDTGMQDYQRSWYTVESRFHSKGCTSATTRTTSIARSGSAKTF